VDNHEPATTEQRLNAAAPATSSTRALRITDDSMAPRFAQGAILIVETEAIPENGNFVIARLNGSEEQLGQFAVENGVACIKPLDPLRSIIRLEDYAAVCGVVTKVIVDVA
jgi:SOS-response transcriptional repressor LexA